MRNIEIKFDVGDTAYHLNRAFERVTKVKIKGWCVEAKNSTALYDVTYTLAGTESTVSENTLFYNPTDAFNQLVLVDTD